MQNSQETASKTQSQSYLRKSKSRETRGPYPVVSFLQDLLATKLLSQEMPSIDNDAKIKNF